MSDQTTPHKDAGIAIGSAFMRSGIAQSPSCRLAEILF